MPSDRNAGDAEKRSPYPSDPQSERPVDSGFRPRTVFGLRVNGREFPIERDEMIVGRGIGCDVLIAKPLVSRQHARLSVRQGSVFVEDLSSRNGVFVNGIAISGGMALKSGDVITLGGEVLELIETVVRIPGAQRTLVDLKAAGSTPTASAVPGLEEEAQTRRADALVLLGGLVDKALALGRGEEAERFIGGHLATLLELTQAGVRQAPELLEIAGAYAIKLADATKKPGWVEYVVKLYSPSKSVLPTTIVDQLYSTLRGVRGVSSPLFRSYLDSLDERADKLTPAERFTLKRMSGLMQLVR
jgi:pSer/pThr/pTyr-binding forkhead associated (FHA) protein